ncbi:hypothetical protein ILUMI_02535 [Ignelater luminosus]|uniref:Uncharacterized protein n=1 Tax=Ignelater luminosus TaxID=2038154 RepID=A0A8K0DI33_IGNLU|nr:hypothetical protein ILUMI_02535 [Ignelater luminosus]
MHPLTPSQAAAARKMGELHKIIGTDALRLMYEASLNSKELEEFQRALTMASPPEALSTPTTSTTATTAEAKKPSKKQRRRARQKTAEERASVVNASVTPPPADAAAHPTSDVASGGTDAAAPGQSCRASIERETTPPASPAPSYSEVLQRPGSAMSCTSVVSHPRTDEDDADSDNGFTTIGRGSENGGRECKPALADGLHLRCITRTHRNPGRVQVGRAYKEILRRPRNTCVHHRLIVSFYVTRADPPAAVNGETLSYPGRAVKTCGVIIDFNYCYTTLSSSYGSKVAVAVTAAKAEVS